MYPDEDVKDEQTPSGAPKQREEPRPCDPVEGCPNRANPTHECTDYCQRKYGPSANNSGGGDGGGDRGDSGVADLPCPPSKSKEKEGLRRRRPPQPKEEVTDDDSDGEAVDADGRRDWDLS